MPDHLQPNDALRRLMKAFGFTQAGLAKAVNDASEQRTGVPGDCTARHVRRWLKGEVAWPHTHSRLSLETVFERPASELGFRAPAAGAREATVRTSGLAHPQEPPVLRRTFVLGLTGSLLTLPPLPESGRLGMADVDRILAAAAELHQIDDLHGGVQVADVAALYIEYVEDAARRCTFSGRVQNRLYAALGEMATSAGWFTFDAQRHEEARRHWDAALRYALLARDNLLQARIWSSMSHQAWQLGHGGEAVSIARAAMDQTRGRRDPQLSALLHTRVAQGHAIQNEAGWCARSLLRAEKEFDREPSEPQRWLGFFNAGELSATATLCFLDLNDYPRAVGAAREALHIVESTPFRRNQMAARVRLGRALAGAGELDEAVTAGDDALWLLAEVHSPRIVARLDQLRDDLLGRGAPGAAEFSERYEAVATCP
jgi:tetratricopeptide (TPR) repeat protein